MQLKILIILHQTATTSYSLPSDARLKILIILHQTATMCLNPTIIVNVENPYNPTSNRNSSEELYETLEVENPYNPTSNRNKGRPMKMSDMLKILIILHQTATAGIDEAKAKVLKILIILHQTATPTAHRLPRLQVENPYNPTSNRNYDPTATPATVLKILIILHQTAT